MKELTVRWQRLVDGGETCPRCGETGEELHRAVAALTASFAPLGISVRLEETAISTDEFEQAPLESNRILLDGRSVEDWLGGGTGQSVCCDVCGPHDCRTVTVDGVDYEAVPADLVVRAGLLAAASLLATANASAEPEPSSFVPISSVVRRGSPPR
ncbi:MAG TPA: DUF2703 domain-containing protein [Propionibacteriaceae bacterium]|nr:DUF2703 domain-containing protein [Propionibacteriaceae bacterium]